METKIKIAARIDPALHKQAKERMRLEWGDEHWQGLLEGFVSGYVSGSAEAPASLTARSSSQHEAFVGALVNLLEKGDPNVVAAVKALLVPYMPSKAGKSRSIRTG